MNATVVFVLLLSAGMVFYTSSCAPQVQPDALDTLGTVDMTIKNARFRLWIADEYSEQQTGLMLVTAERMAPLPDGTKRGMIFVFDYEHQLSFWMRNTIIPLDIAYLDSRGTVVATHTMAPLDERHNQYPSGKPARYAIEVQAGVFTDLGIKAGEQITLPESILKRRQ